MLDNRIMDEDLHCISETSQFERSDSAEKAIELLVQDQDYTGKIKELQAYLDKVNLAKFSSLYLPFFTVFLIFKLVK